MQARYRADYAGEFVISETRWANGQKQQKREWVPSRVENQHISGRAACIGSSDDRHKFDYTKLQRHRGGLLGSKKLQTYAVGSIAKEMRVDFAVESQTESLQTLVESGLSDENIIYTTASNCFQFPQHFYLIPYCPKMLDQTAIAYLAAFDGHKEIFLLGYNKDTQINAPMWHLELVLLMNSYAEVRFYFVGEPTNMFDAWLECANAEAMTYRQFISYCDV